MVHVSGARNDDNGTLKVMVITLLPPWEGIPSLTMNVHKTKRGFNHFQTAHMLCPGALVGELHKDAQRYIFAL